MDQIWKFGQSKTILGCSNCPVVVILVVDGWLLARLELDDLLRLLAEVIGAEGDDVAGLEPTLRLHAQGDAGRRAGDDDIAGIEGHEIRNIRDNLSDAEDHRLRAAPLPLLAVHIEPEFQALHIGDFVWRHQPRAERPEGRRALAFHPIAAALQLKRPFGHVIGEAEAGDMLEGGAFRHI